MSGEEARCGYVGCSGHQCFLDELACRLMLPVVRGRDLATLRLPIVNLSCISDNQKYSALWSMIDKIMNKCCYFNVYYPLAAEKSGVTTDRVISDSRFMAPRYSEM